jgi:hypothetical protein
MAQESKETEQQKHGGGRREVAGDDRRLGAEWPAFNGGQARYRPQMIILVPRRRARRDHGR